jgi:hypothetical protein
MEIFLIGAAIGAGLSAAFICKTFKVRTKATWEAFERATIAQSKHADTLTAENSKLRVALAAGEMTADGKKVAAMTMAALDAVIATEKVA